MPQDLHKHSPRQGSAADALPFLRRPSDLPVIEKGSCASVARLRRHADYQRVYKVGRKQSSASMSYFFRTREADEIVVSSARVGLTVGRVLGKAVDRNRIKRRMREAVRLHLSLLPQNVDVVLHPRKTVRDVAFALLEREIARVFANVAAAATKARS